jgi:hypothetical protein
MKRIAGVGFNSAYYKENRKCFSFLEKRVLELVRPRTALEPICGVGMNLRYFCGGETVLTNTAVNRIVVLPKAVDQIIGELWNR